MYSNPSTLYFYIEYPEIYINLRGYKSLGTSNNNNMGYIQVNY